MAIASDLGPPDGRSSDICSYCGKRLHYDPMQCPHCGNYTDGKGPLAQRAARRTRFRTLALAILVGFFLLIGIIGVILFFVNR